MPGSLLHRPASNEAQRLMDFGGAVEDFRRTAPDHDQAAGSAGLLEIGDVLHERLRLVHLGALGLDVGTVDAADVFGIEHGLHGLDRRERLLELGQQCGLQHLGVDGGFVGGVFVDIPASENQVVEPGERNEILDPGGRPSVLLPRRMVANWVSDPTGSPRPRLMASTPAMKVVDTAPIPGIRMPSLPSAGAIWTLSVAGKGLVLLDGVHERRFSRHGKRRRDRGRWAYPKIV